MNVGVELWSPIREGLWMGGPYEVSVDGSRHAPNISVEFFDTVITLFADAPPVAQASKNFGWGLRIKKPLTLI